MAAYNSNVLPQTDSETKNGSNNNLYQGPFEKVVSNDNKANGMGIATPSTLKQFETFPGAEASEQKKLKDRELARFNDLVSSGAMGRNQTITNEGVVLETFGGAFGEEKGEKPDIQGGANK